MKYSCSDCKHWQIDHNNLSQGQCRHNPPAVYPINTHHGAGTMTVFPTTKNIDWCGKFEVKLLDNPQQLNKEVQ